MSGDHGVRAGEGKAVAEEKTLRPRGDTDTTGFIDQNTNGLPGLVLFLSLLVDQFLIVVENEGNADVRVAVPDRTAGEEAFHCVEVYWVPPMAPL